MLFAALQVTIFTAACFLVIGLRGGVWEPGLFLAVPIVVCFFSYLFSVCVFLGVATRSTIAALLLTLLFWFGIWAVGTAERTLLVFKTMQRHGASVVAVQVEQNQRVARKHGTSHGRRTSPPADQPSAAEMSATDQSGESTALNVAHSIFYGIKTVLPKTSDTIDLLERSLMKAAKLPESGQARRRRMMAAQQEFDRYRSRPFDHLGRRHVAGLRGRRPLLRRPHLLPAGLLDCSVTTVNIVKDNSREPTAPGGQPPTVAHSGSR